MKKYLLFAAIIITASSCSNKLHPSGSVTNSDNLLPPLRVMSYNVRHCSPPSTGLIDINATAAAIKNQHPDIVALQEIDVNTKRSGPFNEAEEIAKKLNMNFYFGRTIDYDGGEYGIAILSKYPISESKTFRLPTDTSTKGEPRALITIKVKLPDGKTIRFGCTHLDAQRLPVNRELQIKEIIRISASEKSPFILAGDLNSTPESSVISELDQHFTRTCQPCKPTIPTPNPNKTIDFISFTKASNFKVISQEVIPEAYASDHFPILAILQ